MQAEAETQTPRSKLTMSLFPNILHPSTYSTLLGDRHRTTTISARTDHQSEHQHAHHVDHHHIAAFFINFLSHIFAPAAYQQRTLSTTCPKDIRCGELESRRNDSTVIIVDDEFVLLETSDSKEQDGGSLCREATIKTRRKQEKQRSRYVDLRRWSDLPYFSCP
jgi:hypothetical protein